MEASAVFAFGIPARVYRGFGLNLFVVARTRFLIGTFPCFQVPFLARNVTESTATKRL